MLSESMLELEDPKGGTDIENGMRKKTQYGIVTPKMMHTLAPLDSAVSSADRIQKAALHTLLCGDLNLDLF